MQMAQFVMLTAMAKHYNPNPSPTPPHPHLNSPNPPRVTFTFLGTRLDRWDAGSAGGALHCPLTFTLTLDPAQRHLQEGEEGRGHAFIQHDAGTHDVGQGVWKQSLKTLFPVSNTKFGHCKSIVLQCKSIVLQFLTCVLVTAIHKCGMLLFVTCMLVTAINKGGMLPFVAHALVKAINKSGLLPFVTCVSMTAMNKGGCCFL